MTTRTLPHAVREMLLFGAVYFFVALIQLRTKLVATPTWFDGTLERNHALLRAFQHTNNEQSRLLQFYIPEALHRVAGLSIAHAYLLQHWAFVLATLLCFHAYLRRWFTPGAAFAGVMTLAAILPLTYMDDLQESAPLLMLTFLLALWAIRERHAGWYTFTLAAGALNNETMLVLPAAYFFCNYPGLRAGPLLRLCGMTLLTSAPAYALVGAVRYFTRDNPHLGPGLQWPDNWHGIFTEAALSPLDWYEARHLYVLFFFGALWIYAALDWRNKPLFLRRAALMVPLFVLAHLITGVITEVRQMEPLAYIVLPLALFFLAPESVTARWRSAALPERDA